MLFWWSTDIGKITSFGRGSCHRTKNKIRRFARNFMGFLQEVERHLSTKSYMWKNALWADSNSTSDLRKSEALQPMLRLWLWKSKFFIKERSYCCVPLWFTSSAGYVHEMLEIKSITGVWWFFYLFCLK